MAIGVATTNRSGKRVVVTVDPATSAPTSNQDAIRTAGDPAIRSNPNHGLKRTPPKAHPKGPKGSRNGPGINDGAGLFNRNGPSRKTSLPQNLRQRKAVKSAS
jgi:hypothetical protein